MVDRRRGADERAQDGELDEERIRADERARVERELRGDTDRSADDLIDRGDRTRDDGYLDDRAGPDARVRAAEPVAAERYVVERDDRREEEIEVTRTRAFSFGQLLTMLVGAALVVLGIFALIETGVDTPLDQPVEQVLGYAHTPWLGILEIVAGGLLVLFSLRPGGRWFVAVLGLALVLGGILVLAQLDWVQDTLGAERAYAWIPIVAGAVALLSSLLTPRRYQRMTGVPTR